MQLRLLRRLAVAALTACAAHSTAVAQATQVSLRDGDRILVKLWMDSVFSDTARVRDGMVVLPRLGAVSVKDVPAAIVADSLKRAYSRVFRSVVAEITPLIRVTISGEAQRPSVYFLDADTPVRDAVAIAGGVNAMGRIGVVVLTRGDSTIKLRGHPGSADFATPLHSGDVIFVQRIGWFQRNLGTLLSATSLLISVLSLARP
jgi:polysaccharide export outer membrane protein